jgi:predicted TIM-barrel fold metal-dependent hydrolase
MPGGLIDIHHHILPPPYVEAVGEAAIGALLVSGRAPVWTPQHSVEAMDRNGIAAAVTSMSAPPLAGADAAAVRRLARQCNVFAAEMVAAHPGRFGSFAALPLPDVDGSLEELAYALDGLHADGIGLLTNYGGLYPGDAAFAPVFDELNRRGAVVYFHPTTSGAPCNCVAGVPAATLDFPFDTTLAITSLLFGGTFARCPNVRFIFSHAGGTLPFLAERIRRLERRPEFRAQVPNGVMAELQRLNFDTALSANRFAFAALLELVSCERVLFGSDYPFAPEDTMTASVAGLKALGLADGDRGLIERGNALSLLPGLAARVRSGA